MFENNYSNEMIEAFQAITNNQHPRALFILLLTTLIIYGYNTNNTQKINEFLMYVAELLEKNYSSSLTWDNSYSEFLMENGIDGESETIDLNVTYPFSGYSAERFLSEIGTNSILSDEMSAESIIQHFVMPDPA